MGGHRPIMTRETPPTNRVVSVPGTAHIDGSSAPKIAARAPGDALRDTRTRIRARVMGFARQSARMARTVRACVEHVRRGVTDSACAVRCFSSSWWREDAERRRGIRAARAKAKRGVRDAVRRAMSEEDGDGDVKTKRRGGTFGHAFLDGFDRVESSTRRRGRYGGGGEDEGRASPSSSKSSKWSWREPRGRVKDVFDDEDDEDVASMFWSRAGPRGFGGGMDDPATRAAFKKMFFDDFERLNNGRARSSSSSSSSFSFSSPRRAASDAGFFASSRCPHCVALGISDRDFITWDELKLALRTQAMKWHPDRHDDASKTMAEAKFKGVYDAYEALARDKV